MIHSIEIHNFRCFKQLSVDGCRRFNIIVGDNGAGKTAILEAIFFALVSSPSIALRYRAIRGLENTFGGTPQEIEEAMWRDLFYMSAWDSPLSVKTMGDGPETRSVIAARGLQKEIEIPFSEAEKNDGSAATVHFRWVNAAGRERVFVPKASATGLTLGDTDEEQLPDFFYFAANQTVTSSENARRFSELSRAGKIPGFIKAVRQEYDRIEHLNIELLGGVPVIYAMLTNGEQMPLATVSGGVNRVISFMLAVASRQRAIICIDEIEDGIFHKRQPNIWKSLTSIARQQQAQIFATTHSEEWLEAVFNDQDVSDVALWRLERLTDGTPVLRQFSGRQIAVAVRGDGEVR